MSRALTSRGFPKVSVPVLSNTTVSISARRSRAAAVPDHDAFLEEPARGHDLDDRDGKAQRAGAGDDQDGDRDGDRCVPVPGGRDPAEERQQRDCVDDRRIERRRPGRPAGGNAPVRPRPPPSSAPFRRGTSLSRAPWSPYRQRAREVHQRRPGPSHPGRHIWAPLSPETSEQSRSEPPSVTTPSTGIRSPAATQYGLPGSISAIGGVAPLAIGVDDGRAARREPCQSGNGRPRLLAHHMVERAADQQEEQQRCRRIEIGVRSVMERVVEAEPEGHEHADRDRHVHVGAPMTQRRPCRREEDPARVEDRRQASAAEIQWNAWRVSAIGPRPDRHRQEHDVHGAESRDRERPDEPGILRIALIRSPS